MQVHGRPSHEAGSFISQPGNSDYDQTIARLKGADLRTLALELADAEAARATSAAERDEALAKANDARAAIARHRAQESAIRDLIFEHALEARRKDERR